MSKLGADPESLRQLASAFERAGEGLDEDARLVARKIRATGWGGPDAQRYLGEWDTTHKVALHQVSGTLTTAAKALRDEAKAQERTSGEDSSSGGGSGGGGWAGGGGGGGGGGGWGDEKPGDPDQKMPTGGYDREDLKYGKEKHADGTWSYKDTDGDGEPDSFVRDPDEPESDTPKHWQDDVKVESEVYKKEYDAFAGSRDRAETGVGSEDGAHATAEAGYQAGADANAGVTATIGKDGVAMKGEAGVSGGIGADAKVEAGLGEYATVGAEGQVFVGGRANVDAGVTLGPDGLGASLGGEAFVGGEAKGNVSADVMGVGVKAEGSAYVGAGVKLDADLNVGWEKTTVSLDVGAALGVGLGGSIEFDVSPKDVVDNVTDLGGDIADGAKDLGKGLSTGFGLWG